VAADGAIVELDDDLTRPTVWPVVQRPPDVQRTRSGTVWVRAYDITTGATGAVISLRLADGHPDGTHRTPPTGPPSPSAALWRVRRYALVGSG
jgi:hypothetical protein